MTLTGVFNGKNVTVSGYLPEGSTLSLSEVDEKSVDTIVDEMADGVNETVFACDIKIFDSNDEVYQPE